jgi:phosphoenolpyruvate carboxylase
VTAEVTRRVVYLQRYIAADLFSKEIDGLLFEISISMATEDLKKEGQEANKRRLCKNYYPSILTYVVDHPKYLSGLYKEFRDSGSISTNEPYRQLLAEVRDRLVNTRRYYDDLLTGKTPSPKYFDIFTSN